MMSLARMRWHLSAVEKTVSAAVCLHPDRDSLERSPLFAHLAANDTEPGP